jgi:hypothetical protein
LWRAILGGLVALIGIVLLAALLLAAGAADPALTGPPRWEMEAAPGACLDVHGLYLPHITIPITIELRASATDHAAWGMTLDDSQYWEVVPPGYMRYAGQTWPFLYVVDGGNTLRLELLPPLEGQDGAHWRLWINLEQAAEGDLAHVGWGWALLAEPGVCWEQLRVYGPA